jgi:sphingosine kinase
MDMQQAPLLLTGIMGCDHALHVQGYFQSPDWEQRAKIPFCMVPSGSGNALAANCGFWNATTAAHAICKGKRRHIDIFSVLQPPNRRYYAFLSTYFGTMANLDIGTDHLRSVMLLHQNGETAAYRISIHRHNSPCYMLTSL